VEFDGSNNNLDEFMRTSRDLERFVMMVAQQGCEYWTTHSVVDTGYNASHVQPEVQRGEDGTIEGVVHATGYYAKWREIGSSRAGPRAPEWVLRSFKEQIEG
jgi:hypothetical protein